MSNVIHIFTGRAIDPATGVLPLPGECLGCFVHRMVEEGGCSDGFGWVEHYRLVRARRAVTLTQRLTNQGCGCDCEVVSEVWEPSPELWSVDQHSGALVAPDGLPPCTKVRPGSTQPCTLWVPAARLAL
ncbi:DUF2695 domain-containing protein [Intrasporangium calvum]|uniref:DUF2695 domain-containing protein n=1 Tax=Intrasporangium calvum TaxID=53358 RepID=A0ABT5GCY2_9MICO|nr:DUF2695 domain-containing protein [Intrasporangium calvum]MDC5695650.1 DUF2695 domain-containing protein [Intrasporangium calvum]